MKSKGEKVKEALEHGRNTFTGKSYSSTYKTLLSHRKKLPVYEQMDEFCECFSNNQVMIVVGETGSGKTTQIPQFVAHLNSSQTEGKITVCTQPRRMSAITAATRVAKEMDVTLGAGVGYTIRFEDRTTPRTFLQYATDGALLRGDVHEQTLATDILMALLKGLVKKRRDLKVIVMSAATDSDKLQRYWNEGSAIKVLTFRVTCRTFPVKIVYTKEPEPDYIEAAIRTVLTIHYTEGPGDILVFLTGAEEIEEACIRLENDEYLKTSGIGPLVCIPLHASLSLQEQKKIYDPPPPPRFIGGPPGRKVILATNIAETSLTIDGIVYVVDPGFSKEAIYNPRIRVECLLVNPISKASARQRAGRAGRTKPGKCFRLFTEKDFQSELEEHTHPQILKSNLSSVVLTLVKLGIKDLVRFDYLDAPAPETLMRALELLTYLAALDDDGNLTSLGTIMAEFPLEPQLAKTLIVSPDFKCSNEILTLAAMLSAPVVWRQPRGQQKEADAAKALFSVPGSDHLTLINVYNEYKSNVHDKNWAHSHYLSLKALSQADKARDLLQDLMEQFDIELVSESDPQKLPGLVSQALVCGFFMQVAHSVKGSGTYLTIQDNQVVSPDPSCALGAKPAEWVIYNEFVLTTRPNIRTITEIRPEWLLNYASNYFDLKYFPDGPTNRALQN
ncbi:putative pre-mRNA-splicing factor ATP-dependent RNA helicase prp43 [Mycena sanguinolenta]|uniref:RNA helicase n=1 Tax=Mycena sanguinolenta TaxID=230812 RepID=A0A8H6YRS8_9AGAR|nr:putative pre-mRNA-splicing factor ATP-dependent RNA helicase prp43 [Mycena sanguinolenta]